MSMALDRSSRRVLGVLAEKELATPNQYPMSVNALTSGCNQKTARDPQMHLREFEVEGVLRSLFVAQWVTNSTPAGGRVVKWKHRLATRLAVEPDELAVVAELFLRGAQTPGELRANANRLHPIADQSALEAVLRRLSDKNLVALGPPRPGERARRWDHRLYGDDEAIEPLTAAPEPEARDFEAPPRAPVASGPSLAALLQRLEHLEDRVQDLEARIDRSGES
ncbi:MAG: DUF480 domain-containing protein [Planctomycetes bacterium]|nr:DUF480 domain-containing protein [Planctomycetota bacterium]